MSAVASLLLDRQVPVSGSDARDSAVLHSLAARGALVQVGQRAANLDAVPGGASAVIVSTAIHDENPELIAARQRGIPVVHRAVALATLMHGQRGVIVAGTHGKTSTTSILTAALRHAGAAPSYAIGGILDDSGRSAEIGSGDAFIAEADESDGSFLAFRPHGIVLTTVEPDHLDFHGSAAAYYNIFRRLLARLRPGGFLIAGIDDAGVRDVLLDAPPGCHVITYGQSVAADLRLDAIRPDGHHTVATLRLPDGTGTELRVNLPGAHMAANAAAAVAAGLQLGVPLRDIVDGVGSFRGVGRRFEWRGDERGVRVFDDYAHHPTEVAATLAAARGVAGHGRVIVIFQPHLYSRTRQFADAFAAALGAADCALVLPIYGAREDPVAGVSSGLITAAMATDTQTPPMPDDRDAAFQSAAGFVADYARPGDVVLTMGAGDVTELAPALLAALATAHQGGAHA